uniref:Strictosidine synthase conserved region domain-containing protein n=1 Tax=Gossypium raimondii TaxID=29730 RepID=A0A0D2U4W0_GOSRA|nr:hypothetical protein B456_008G173900 [Gossypium raimondii]
MFLLSIKFLIVAFFLSQNILQTCQQLPISKNFFQIQLTQATGPESIAFDCKNEGPYVGVSDGRILKWQGSNLGWKEFAITSPNRQILFSAITFDRSGRLLKYDPRTKEVSVMYKGLAFPNGVALSKDHSFLLVAESIKMRILKFKVQDGGRGYVPEQLVQLSRIPDNIKSNEKGEFWVALNTGRESIQTDWLGFSIDPIGVKYDQDGKVLKQLDGNGGLTFNSVSEILEFNGTLYLGSVVKPYLGIFHA